MLQQGTSGCAQATHLRLRFGGRSFADCWASCRRSTTSSAIFREPSEERRISRSAVVSASPSLQVILPAISPAEIRSLGCVLRKPTTWSWQESGLRWRHIAGKYNLEEMLAVVRPALRLMRRVLTLAPEDWAYWVLERRMAPAVRRGRTSES